MRKTTNFLIAIIIRRCIELKAVKYGTYQNSGKCIKNHEQTASDWQPVVELSNIFYGAHSTT
jgi:hypothetical protein